MKKNKIQIPTGTKDLKSQELDNMNYLKEKWINLLKKNNYNEIQTPMFEDKELFVRGVGEFSDIVSKEMFELGEYVLRPEGTAPIMRYYLENGLNSFEKYSYFAPFFRKEKPQKGRYRQFFQYGLEIFKEKAPQAELDCMLLIKEFYDGLNVKYKININYIPNDMMLKTYEIDLKKYYESNIEKLTEASVKKLQSDSILRILDSKEDKEVNASAPSILNFLNEMEKKEWAVLLELFKEFDIPFEIDTSLVRGLDYYQGLVFEVVDMSNKLGSQNALGGGGRYNKLSQQLSDVEISAFGFAGGVERLLLQIEDDLFNTDEDIKKITFVSDQAIIKELYLLKQSFSQYKNVYVDINFNKDLGFKKQFKRADQIKSDYVVVIGQLEIANNTVKIKKMNDGTEKELAIKFNDLTIKDILF